MDRTCHKVFTVLWDVHAIDGPRLRALQFSDGGAVIHIPVGNLRKISEHRETSECSCRCCTLHTFVNYCHCLCPRGKARRNMWWGYIDLVLAVLKAQKLTWFIKHDNKEKKMIKHRNRIFKVKIGQSLLFERSCSDCYPMPNCLWVPSNIGVLLFL